MNSNRLLVMFFVSLFVVPASFVRLCLAQENIEGILEQTKSSIDTPENKEKIAGWMEKYGEFWPLRLANARTLGSKDIQLALKVLAFKDFQFSMMMAKLQKKELELAMKEASIAKNTELERYFRACSDRLKDPKNKAFEHFKDEECSKIFSRYAEEMSEDNSSYEEGKKQQAQFMEQMLKQQKKKKRYEDSTEDTEDEE